MSHKIRYKLTDENAQTFLGYQWELKRWEQTDGRGGLCGSGWLHCYSDPLVALLHNPIHAAIDDPRLFKVQVRGLTLGDRGMKEGWTEMRLFEEIEPPKITPINRVAYGILAAKQVFEEKGWNKWADSWLAGERSAADAHAAAADAHAAHAAAAAAYAAYAYAADTADTAAAYAADDAAYADCLKLPKLARAAMKVK